MSRTRRGRPGTKPLAQHSAVALLLSASTACSPEPLDLGDDPDFVWWSDVEQGDTSDWTARGSSWENAGGELSVVDAPTRSGTHAIASKVIPSAEQSAAVLILEDIPEEAYCSGWFYVPEVPAPSVYWVVFKVGAPEDQGGAVDVWAFDLDPAGSDHVSLRAFSSVDDTGLLRDVEIRVGRWFHLEAFVRGSVDDGAVRLWLDGELVFDFGGSMDPSNGLLFTVGGGSEQLEGGEAVLYIDDAAVTRRRLGPGSGPFRASMTR